MKKCNYLKKVVVLSVLIVSTGIYSWGQMPENRNRGDFEHNALNLTESQKEQVKSFKLEFIKYNTPLKNSLQIKEAELHAKSVGDNVDIKSVNKLIEEIGDIKTQLEKNKFAQKQKIRNILNDEQKVIFDAKPGKHGFMGRRGHKMHKDNRTMNDKCKCGERTDHKKGRGKMKPDSDQNELEVLE